MITVSKTFLLLKQIAPPALQPLPKCTDIIKNSADIILRQLSRSYSKNYCCCLVYWTLLFHAHTRSFVNRFYCPCRWWTTVPLHVLLSVFSTYPNWQLQRKLPSSFWQTCAQAPPPILHSLISATVYITISLMINKDLGWLYQNWFFVRPKVLGYHFVLSSLMVSDASISWFFVDKLCPMLSWLLVKKYSQNFEGNISPFRIRSTYGLPLGHHQFKIVRKIQIGGNGIACLVPEQE